MKPLQLTKEQQKESIEAIKSYYFNEREEEITELAATLLLDFIVKNIGPHIYNQALTDAHSFMGEKIDELFTLEKSPASK
ncbi:MULTISPECIES: DUF2164 domain-containing protein [Sporomusa]|jgi:uncharacterized protein (DUF2164 family)|uniref:DUF2164 domain-containing protein n=1 Tax=Sporomusa sphaeroides DSM 2875 TaxID=1337886 RepID=A0ABM9W5Y8_9FIRM|nr:MULTISPECIES: DUF2164 domain-containing protein [Sporomusa]MCM0759847.1 DUF2164 domain-containing protein [Sporomusa sphaeroides DSM 2875]OLS55703.1 hypothetical protein SPSPH_30320 [Sporomusa sphaeroides DSM 2875]CVK19371.1 hypothetical protein SSPH_02022 [Sporomusa sphaeroides DSM 2875]HML35055.1 DUF2164 domain-containing protein [Sporomusa sphaeroides]